MTRTLISTLAALVVARFFLVDGVAAGILALVCTLAGAMTADLTGAALRKVRGAGAPPKGTA